MSTDDRRLLRALARAGLHVTHEGAVYTVRLSAAPDAPAADILLPASLPLEAKAVRQLADLAAVHHPHGGRVCRVCATPDFHPGDSGVAIGSVLETEGVVLPAAVGVDINCGMRLHAVDLTLDRFLADKERFVALAKGDYLLGTRDVAMSAPAMAALFAHGLPSWIDEVQRRPLGRLRAADWGQVARETSDTPLVDAEGRAFSRVFASGALAGDVSWAPHGLVPEAGGDVRDPGLATVGRGNHFVELQVVDELLNRREAWALGLKQGQLAFMVHSGSRDVGRAIGGRWADLARKAWPAGVKHPASGLFPLVDGAERLLSAYLTAEATAANYGFANRALLAELCRLRLREVFGDVSAPLVCDLPHNLTLPAGDGRWVARKGACPAEAGRPVVIPGSMGAPSFVAVGLGNDRWLSSASHGAGRASSRGAMGRAVRDDAHLRALGLDGVECITLREERRVEEAPAAYKPIGPVVDAQVDAGVLKVVARLRPLLTFKA
jgi:tRNA-splicing ligase RtcB